MMPRISNNIKQGFGVTDLSPLSHQLSHYTPGVGVVYTGSYQCIRPRDDGKISVIFFLFAENLELL